MIDRSSIEQAYAFLHEHTSFLSDIQHAVVVMEDWLMQ